MVFQNLCAAFPYDDVHLQCCLSCLDLRSYFVNLIEHGAHGRKNFRISPSWAVYRIGHMVYILLQTLLCRIPSSEENLAEH